MDGAPDITNLCGLADACRYDANSLANGHKPSATALRKKLSQITKECAILRTQALAYQKALKGAKKTPAAPEPTQADPDIEDLGDEVADMTLERTKPKPRGGRKPRAR